MSTFQLHVLQIVRARLCTKRQRHSHNEDSVCAHQCSAIHFKWEMIMIVCYNVGICNSLAIILMWLDLECSSFLYARCMAKWSLDVTIVETLIMSFSSALIIMHLKYGQYIILFMLLAKEAGKQPRMNWVCLGEWHKVIAERSWTIDVFATCLLPLTNQPVKHTVQEKKKNATGSFSIANICIYLCS